MLNDLKIKTKTVKQRESSRTEIVEKLENLLKHDTMYMSVANIESDAP